MVALNRAIAVGELRGPGRRPGRPRRSSTPTSSTAYQPFHAARADLLVRAGRVDEAVAAYDRAIELTTNPAERRFLLEQRAGADRRP